jgi:hypothetical protein
VAFFEEKYAGIGRFAYQQLRETEWIGLRGTQRDEEKLFRTTRFQ